MRGAIVGLLTRRVESTRRIAGLAAQPGENQRDDREADEKRDEEANAGDDGNAAHHYRCLATLSCAGDRPH